jgi:hypothetical protein
MRIPHGRAADDSEELREYKRELEMCWKAYDEDDSGELDQAEFIMVRQCDDCVWHLQCHQTVFIKCTKDNPPFSIDRWCRSCCRMRGRRRSRPRSRPCRGQSAWTSLTQHL